MKITKRQLRKMISELSVVNPVQIDDHDELLFRIAMKAKDMMPANEVLGLDRDSFEDMVVYIYETHFDTTGEGWAPYEEDLIAIEDHLTIKDDLQESKKKVRTKVKITKRQLRRIIKEEKQKILKEAPAGQYDQRMYEMFKEAILETVYDVAVEQDLTEPDGMNITAEAVQAASAALSDAAREFYKGQGMEHGMPSVKIGR